MPKRRRERERERKEEVGGRHMSGTRQISCGDEVRDEDRVDSVFARGTAPIVCDEEWGVLQKHRQKHEHRNDAHCQQHQHSCTHTPPPKSMKARDVRDRPLGGQGRGQGEGAVERTSVGVVFDQLHLLLARRLLRAGHLTQGVQLHSTNTQIESATNNRQTDSRRGGGETNNFAFLKVRNQHQSVQIDHERRSEEEGGQI
jgi:hypothetical protein